MSVAPPDIHEDEIPPTLCACPNSCSGSYTVRVKALEPALETVASTEVFGFWSRHEYADDTACAWLAMGGGICYANPHVDLFPPFDTHWFESSCTQIGPFDSDGYFYILKVGKYFNWDFGDPNKRTNVDQYVELLLQSGVGVSTTIYHADSGEAHQLIFFVGITTGSNDCS